MSKLYGLTLDATVSVPDDFEEVQAFDGTVVGFKTPDGRLLKPWTTFEQQAGEEYRDLKESDLNELGVSLEHEGREFEQIDADGVPL